MHMAMLRCAVEQAAKQAGNYRTCDLKKKTTTAMHTYFTTYVQSIASINHIYVTERDHKRIKTTNMSVCLNERTNGDETKTTEHQKTNIACNLSFIER